MKALSLTQPWSTLVAIGAKQFETRSWPAHIRGPIAIHASKIFPAWARSECVAWPFYDVLKEGRLNSDTLPLGAVIATCDLVDCMRITASNAPGGQEYHFGNYEPGRYMFQLANVRRAVAPIPARGMQRWWVWDETPHVCPVCNALGLNFRIACTACAGA